MLTKTTGSRDFCVDWETIVPNSRTKGIIWYGPSFEPMDSPIDQPGSEIVITYEHGPMHQTIVANDFFKK